MPKRALITGITGQDGSYLAELLLSKDYEVFGMVRRTSTDSLERIKHILDKLHIVSGDLSDQQSINRIIEEVRPHEVYNLAAQSFVTASFNQPILTGDVTGLGAARVLEAIKNIDTAIKFYQASSSEMTAVYNTPINEATPLKARSPYGCAKIYAHNMTVNYREAYGMYAVSGILFNHCGPRRGLEFVTRKITDGVAKIVCGKQDKLYLGNLDAKRDWGFVGDYVEAMFLMLQQDFPDDYVIATGETHSVMEFVDAAFLHVGLDYHEYVEIDSEFYRPTEVDVLIGDASKAKAVLGWKPTTSFKELVEIMVENDLKIQKGT